MAGKGCNPKEYNILNICGHRVLLAAMSMHPICLGFTRKEYNIQKKHNFYFLRRHESEKKKNGAVEAAEADTWFVARGRSAMLRTDGFDQLHNLKLLRLFS